MKILLLGEYSGFFNSLKEGLTTLGHTVVLAGKKDGFKNYPVDISLEPVFFTKGFPLFIRKLIHKLTQKDITAWETWYIFKQQKEKFANYDVVFLINEQPVTKQYTTEKKILTYIFKHNKNVYLSACGDDVVYLNFLKNYNSDHNLLKPYLENPKLKPYYIYALHYLSRNSKKIHDLVFKNIKAVIPGDFDYVMAYTNTPIAKPLIPFPVRTHLLPYKEPVIKDKIIIFHGINKVNYHKKGNRFFEEALAIISNKYSDKIEIITATSLPYNEYINKYNQCHILLDQAYAYDQGYNALEAMAKGKVVFTGASSQWLAHYNIKEDTVAIHATPNAKEIATKLEWLILHPEKIIEIAKNARDFIEKEHDHVEIARKYLISFSN